MRKYLLAIVGLLALPSLLFGDATEASRQRNFVNDKANSIPITASYVDGEFDNLITKVNSKVLAKATAPSSPTTGDTWVDTSITPAHVKVYDGTNWTGVACSKGADVASATTTTLGSAGCFFDITGTTTITSVTAKPAGMIVMLQFDGALTFTDGSNLKLNGNFTTAADSTITLISDGTNWFELSRQPDNSFTPTAANALAGSVVQSVITYSRAVGSATATAVIDDTVPTTSETGNLSALDRAITPNNSSNRLVVELELYISAAGAGIAAVGIVQDAGSSHIATVAQAMPAADSPEVVHLVHEMAAGTTSSTTFKVYVGHNGGSQVTMNGAASTGGRLFGAVASSSLRVTEIKV